MMMTAQQKNHKPYNDFSCSLLERKILLSAFCCDRKVFFILYKRFAPVTWWNFYGLYTKTSSMKIKYIEIKILFPTLRQIIGSYWIIVHSELLFRKTDYFLGCYFLFLCIIIALSHNYTAIKLYCQLILLRFINSIFRHESCNSYPSTDIQYISSLRVYPWLHIKKIIVIERYKSLVYNVH